MNVFVRILVGAVIGGTIGAGIGLACQRANKLRRRAG
jgi:gas vesicle protein